MNIKLFPVVMVLVVSQFLVAADALHTPENGSAERESICDGARAFVIAEYAPSKLPQPIVFKISRLEVSGNYCSFEAYPIFKDGSAVSTEYMMDIVFELCLKRTGGKWSVIYDLSRTDVPTDREMKQMWSKFPKDFPLLLLQQDWRDRFNRVK